MGKSIKVQRIGNRLKSKARQKGNVSQEKATREGK